MNVVNAKNSHLIIDDFFNEEELNEIWQELNLITHPRKMLPATDERSGSATFKGKILKDNYVCPLTTHYVDRTFSNIEYNIHKIYSPEVNKIIYDMGYEFNYYYSTEPSENYTMVSYYDNEHYYQPHVDDAVLTVLYWCHKEPKGFNGGDLTLHEIGVDVEYKNNRLVIFPSHLTHSVSSVESFHGKDPFEGYGRYCITHFLYYKKAFNLPK